MGHNLLDDFAEEISKWAGWRTGEILFDENDHLPILAFYDPEENLAPRYLRFSGLWTVLRHRMLQARYIGGENYDQQLVKYLKAIEHTTLTQAIFNRERRHLYLHFENATRLHLLCSTLRPETYRVTFATEEAQPDICYSVYGTGILRGRFKRLNS